MKSLITIICLLALTGCQGDSGVIATPEAGTGNSSDTTDTAGGSTDTNSTDGAGGNTDTNGTDGTGGSTDANGTDSTGGSTDTNGTDSTGGSTDANGTDSTGGSTDANGTDSTGGSTDTNGTDGTGGSTDANGTDSTGGSTDTNGTDGTGGSTDTNGTEGTGGSTDTNGTGGSTSGTDGTGGTDQGGITIGTSGTGGNIVTNGTDGNGNGSATPPAVVTGLSAIHRSGQTFLTWNEVDSETHYHVYRSEQPINTANLSSATLLTSRWGPIDQDSSLHKHGTIDMPEYLVIEDSGAQLSADTGLFVHTTQPGQAGSAYYAVTSVLEGNENKTVVEGSNTLAAALAELEQTPRPVLTASYNDGLGRIYTHYMDYANWNPTLNGYAFNYVTALPHNFDPARSYPLQVYLHAFGGKVNVISETEYRWETIQLFLSDPGLDESAMHTWWYGHAADHNYLTDGPIPDSGKIENFTEQRVMIAVNEVIDNPDFNVDTDLIHAYGNSMGASGVVSLGLRYPSVFTGIYASQPMTNYAGSQLFEEHLQQLWGEQSSNLPNVIRGPNTSAISKYSAEGSQPVAIWDWMNHQQQVRLRSADDFAYLIIDIGKEDYTIDYMTQGFPLIEALTDGKIPFSAALLEGVDHNWLDFNAVNGNQFGLQASDVNPWRYPNSLSFVALQNASGSGSVPPATLGDDNYNINIEWSTPQHAFHQSIVDTAERYQISLRSVDADQTVSVTPRNTVVFRPSSGQQCTWTATRNSDDQQIGSGSLTVDGNALVTAVAVPVLSGNGSRLTIDCPG